MWEVSYKVALDVTWYLHKLQSWIMHPSQGNVTTLLTGDPLLWAYFPHPPVVWNISALISRQWLTDSYACQQTLFVATCSRLEVNPTSYRFCTQRCRIVNGARLAIKMWEVSYKVAITINTRSKPHFILSHCTEWCQSTLYRQSRRTLWCSGHSARGWCWCPPGHHKGMIHSCFRAIVSSFVHLPWWQWCSQELWLDLSFPLSHSTIS